MASKVMSISDSAVQRQRALGTQIQPQVQARFVQRAPDRNVLAGGKIENQLQSSQGGGSPLSEQIRAYMEPRFKADFSRVRVHTGEQAVQMNRELGAQALTHGHNIYYGAGKSPGVNELTAHELTHVVQQTGGIQRKCAACETEENKPQELQLQAKETEQGSKPPINVGTEPDDPKAKLDQAIKIVQQALEAGRSNQGGTKGAGSSDAEKQKQGLQTTLNYLHTLKESGNVDEILKVTQPIFAAAQGDLKAANQIIQQKQSTQTNSKEDTTPTIQRMAQAALAGPLITIGPVGWAILGVGTLYFGYQAYQAYERSRPVTESIPRTGSRSRRRGFKCRCKARYTGKENPPEHCPKFVEGVGSNKREAQKNAKLTAPPECRKFYGHCDCPPL